MLKAGGPRLDGKRIFGTAFGMSPSDVDITRGRLLQFFNHEAQVLVKMQIDNTIHFDLTCSELFDYYTQSLPA
jgi:hypothetical protein